MNRKLQMSAYVLAAILTAYFILPVEAQTRKRNTRNQTDPAKTQQAKAAEPKAVPPKRNERPGESDSNSAKGNNSSTPGQVRGSVPTFRYEFSQPEFVIPSIKIEHDDAGVGTISFKKKGEDEIITDPIRVSPKALSRINEALTALNFLDSTENYQYERDFSHLGNIKFSRTQNGRTREVGFNWTSNKDAKTLMDEYRKIGNQYIWIFDISLSRENQPLEAPRLFDTLDSMIRRNEISDPYQMEPFLLELSNDERIPLIARNHATKLIKQFEKERAKEEKKKAETN